MLVAGTIVAGYRIERVLGYGGMGVVYEVTELSLGRPAALKLLGPQLANDERFIERFRREGEIQASLEHPHVVPVYQAGESEHGLFLAMRLVRGPNLKELIVRGLEPGRALALLGPIADAIDTAHGADLVHRDIKPQNVLIGTGDHPFLADFGLGRAPGAATLTATGQMAGTIEYIAPEQIQGARATAQSDIYSFGIVVYESLVGRVPFAGESEAATLYAHLSETPPHPSECCPALPAGVDAPLLQALAKNPDERPTSATDLVREVGRALGKPAPGPRASLPYELIAAGGGVQPTRAARAPTTFWRSRGDGGKTRLDPDMPALGERRRRGLIAAGLVGAVVLAVTGGVFALSANDSGRSDRAPSSPRVTTAASASATGRDAVVAKRRRKFRARTLRRSGIGLIEIGRPRPDVEGDYGEGSDAAGEDFGYSGRYGEIRVGYDNQARVISAYTFSDRFSYPTRGRDLTLASGFELVKTFLADSESGWKSVACSEVNYVTSIRTAGGRRLRATWTFPNDNSSTATYTVADAQRSESPRCDISDGQGTTAQSCPSVPDVGPTGADPADAVDLSATGVDCDTAIKIADDFYPTLIQQGAGSGPVEVEGLSCTEQSGASGVRCEGESGETVSFGLG